MTKRNSIKAVRLSDSMDESQFNEVSRWLNKWGIKHIARFPYMAIKDEDGFDLEINFGDWVVYWPDTDRIRALTNTEFLGSGA